MGNKDKLAAVISALTDLDGVPIKFSVHNQIRELQESLQHEVEAIEADEEDE